MQGLAHDMTYQWAKLHPIVATQLGIPGYDGMLDTPSAAEDQRDLALIRTWQARLTAIPISGEPLNVRDDAVLLRAQLTGLERQYTVYRTETKDYSAPGNAITDILFTQFQRLPVAGRDNATAADVHAAWLNITARLAKSPAYIAAGEYLVTHPGHLQGIVGADELAGTPDFFNGSLTDAAKAQLPAADFAKFMPARDAALSAMAQEKAYIDAHIAAWPENYAIGRAPTTAC